MMSFVCLPSPLQAGHGVDKLPGQHESGSLFSDKGLHPILFVLTKHFVVTNYFSKREKNVNNSLITNFN